MIAVITGDIVSSRKMPPKSGWMKRLKHIIEKQAGEPLRWAMFRGDGFQVELQHPGEALRIALMIRSGLKSIAGLHQLGLDARMGIGIGAKGYTGETVGISDGEAYRLSGALLDTLKEEGDRIKLSTGVSTFDRKFNVCLTLANAIVEDWSQRSAELVWMRLSDSDATQERLAKKLKITQPAIFKRYSKSHVRELLELIAYFREEIALYTATEKKRKADGK
jgi:hypothetical protein